LKQSTQLVAPDRPAGTAAASATLFENRRDIRALTSLRLLPAVAVVFYHCQDYFDCLQADVSRLAFTHTLTYFFVLSGFVLTINYFNISSVVSALRFYIARFARIWPAHVISLFLLLALVPEVFKVKVASLPVFLANMFMVQAWVPSWQYYFSYNAPSWSNSTEIFFYLSFPLLAWAMRRHWYAPLCVATASVAALICLCNALHLPEFDRVGLSVQALTYINPLARLLEFTVGMTAALLFYHHLARRHLSTITATVLELAAFGLVAFLMVNAMSWRQACLPVVGNAASMWFLNSGIPVLSTAALILVIATEKGLISRLLSIRPLVVLGELSFGMYMLHCVLLSYRSISFPQERSVTAFLLFVITLLLSAHFMWFAIERPMRRLIISIGDNVFRLKRKYGETRPFSKRLTATLAENLKPGRRAIWGLLEGAALAFFIYFSLPALHTVPAHEARAAIARLPASPRDVSYPPYLSCRGASACRSAAGARVKLVWQALADEPLDFSVQATALDHGNNVVGRLTYKQDPRKSKVARGTVWIESFDVPVKPGATAREVAITMRRGKKKAVLPGDHPAIRGPEHSLVIPVAPGKPVS
jgi:peptidoglycan/LPS O-acetylase OafA/YrhL